VKCGKMRGLRGLFNNTVREITHIVRGDYAYSTADYAHSTVEWARKWLIFLNVSGNGVLMVLRTFSVGEYDGCKGVSRAGKHAGVRRKVGCVEWLFDACANSEREMGT